MRTLNFAVRALSLLILVGPAFAATDALQEAADRCDIENLRHMFDSGQAQANPAGWRNPLLLRVAEGTWCDNPARHEAAVKLALDRGLKPNARGMYAYTALHAVATRADKSNIVELLLARGADVNAQDNSKNTPLFHAARAGAINNIKVLLSHGADLKTVNIWGQTALQVAKKENQDDAAELLEAALAGRKVDAPPAPAAYAALPAAAGASQTRPRPAAAPAVEKPGFQLPQRPDDAALVVGVESYSNELPKAEFAERDAEAVRAHLAALGVPDRNIKVLLGAKASRGQLEAYLEDWLPRVAKPEGRVFFYFSGHGAPDPASGEAYLVTVDGDPKFLDKTAFPLKRLYADLAALKTGQVIAALDSCFSGAGGRSVLAEGTRPLVNSVKSALPGGSKLTVFTATAPSETTGTMKEQGHGMFTYFLLKGLRDAAANKKRLTAQGLLDFLKPKVQDEAGRQNRDQTPGLLGSGRAVLLK